MNADIIIKEITMNDSIKIAYTKNKIKSKKKIPTLKNKKPCSVICH